jgi:hypothetical protein
MLAINWQVKYYRPMAQKYSCEVIDIRSAWKKYLDVNGYGAFQAIER